MSDTIYVTRSGTYYKDKKYEAGESIPTNRWGGPAIQSSGASQPVIENKQNNANNNQVQAQESITEPESQESKNSPSFSVIDSSKLKEENTQRTQAFVKNTMFNRPVDPSETISPVPKVEQSAFTFDIDTRSRIDSDVPASKGEKLNRAFSEARQDFKDNLLTQNNYQTPDAFKNVETAGKVVVLGGASFGIGVVKGGIGVVKDVVTGQIITKTGESLTELASNPKGVFENVKIEFNKNPTGFIGEQVGYAVTLNKIPGVTKKVVAGSRSYLRRYEVAGSKYDPLKDVPSTGEPFYTGDLDVVPNVQTTLTGERVNPKLLYEKTKPSPLGLDDTSLYAMEKANKRFDIELESGKVVKSSPIFDDATFIPESRIEGAGFVEVKSSDLNVRVPVDKVFEGRYIGERTKTDFFPKPEKVQRVYAENIAPSSKPLFDVKPKKNVVEADYIEFKEPDIVRDSSVQKKLNFDDKTGGFIGANVGLFTESQKLFDSIRAEFNVRPRGELSVESPSGKIPKGKLVPVVDLNNRQYVSSGNKIFSNNVSSVKNVQDVKPVSESVLFEDVKPVQDQVYRFRQKNKASPVQDNILLQKPKQDQAVALKIVQKQEVKQIYSPISKQVSRKEKLFRYKTAKAEKFVLPKIKNSSKNKRSESFVAEVRRRGKFVGLGVFDSSVKAFDVARGVVSNSASASLRVRRVGGGVVSPRGFLGEQFVLSKSDRGVLIERRGKRIKSVGEKAEITMKGILVNRSKGKVFGGRL